MAYFVGQVKHESSRTRAGNMVTESVDMSMNVGDTHANVFEDIDD